jgi:benzoylformate decarboxylase
MTDSVHTSAPQEQANGAGASAARSVREAAFDVMRRYGMTRIFGNPGSTEIHFLTNLPGDLEFVLGLHEGSVVGMATGYAIARGRPAFVNLHTAAGLGNAINAIANARDAKAPLVIVVGQQDRRQIAFEPFLTGRHLDRLAGEYPVWTNLPARAQDVPGAIARAYHEAQAQMAPALVVVPMGDWLEPVDELAAGSPLRTVRPQSVAPEELTELADLLARARSPALVVGSEDSRESWDAVVALAERLRCPVWQEPFVRRAGFPQDHELFAGFLGWRRRVMHQALAPHDVVVAVGTNAFRLYLFDEPVAVVEPDTKVAVITADPSEAHRSPCELAVVAPVAATCRALTALLEPRAGGRPQSFPRPAPLSAPAPGEPLSAGHVLDALAARLPPDAVVVEETPSSQPELYRRVAIRSPLGFVGTANGGLGSGLSGAIGLRMGLPDRPVVGVIGDGSSIYAIQALWSAARYGVGVLLIVMANGGYAVMDALAREHGGQGPWPRFGTVDVAGLARCFGCPSRRVETHAELLAALDEVLPGLAGRDEPLVLEISLGE